MEEILKFIMLLINKNNFELMKIKFLSPLLNSIDKKKVI